MRKLRIEKLVINICAGESGDKLTRTYLVTKLWFLLPLISCPGAAKVLDQLTGQQPVYSRARYTVRAFGIRRNEEIAVHCTVRGPKVRSTIPG